jgi:hypothetical protein
MSDVQFDEQSYASPQRPSVGRPKGLIGLAIRFGIAKDEKEAEKGLLLIAGIAALAAAGLILINRSPEPMPPEPVVPMPNSGYGR